MAPGGERGSEGGGGVVGGVVGGAGRGAGARSGQQVLRESLKLTAVALKRGGVPFALVGGYAAWARGAPEPVHDADFVVAAEDADRAAGAITEAGLVVERPPEDWLFKVRLPGGAGAGGGSPAGADPGGEPLEVSGGVLVDVLWRLCDRPVGRDLLDRVDVMPVLSVRMPVLAATDVVSGKLSALSEHYCDFATLLPVARALREQVDWPTVRRDVGPNPYAMALLHLLELLGVVEAEQLEDGGAAPTRG